MSEKVDDLPMLDRLRLLSRDTEHVTTPPRAESLEKLLLQGLHNDDEQVLNQVLDRANEELIDNTVRRLPVEAVVPLIQVLQKYLKVCMNSIYLVQLNNLTLCLASEQNIL